MNCSQVRRVLSYLLLEVEGEMLMSVMRHVTRLEFHSYDEDKAFIYNGNYNSYLTHTDMNSVV